MTPGDANAGSCRRTLIVDAQRDCAMSLATLLELNGYEVGVAFDVDAALARADQERPEAVLIEVGLAGGLGFELCRELRARSWARECLMLAVTAWSRAEDRRRAREAGFDHYLLKPVQFETLDTLLRRTDRRRGGRGRRSDG